MGDLTNLESSDTIKIAGASATGSETNFVNASANGDLQTTDIMNTAASSTVLSLTTSAVAVRVAGSNLQDRKYIIMEGLGSGIVWGFSPSSQTFNLFKNQIIMLPCGQNITVYAKVTTGTADLSVGELS